MGELEKEYGTRVDFNVVPPAQTAQSAQDLAELGFTDLKHGLVVFSATGEPVLKLPGHQFGREQIEPGIAKALAAR